MRLLSARRTLSFLAAQPPCAIRTAASEDDAPTSGGSQLGWHQDRWSTLDRDPKITVYLAIDPATEDNGCMHIVKRSHTLGIVNPQQGAAFVRDEAQINEVLSSYPSKPLPLQPGEIILLSTLCLQCVCPMPRRRARTAARS